MSYSVLFAPAAFHFLSKDGKKIRNSDVESFISTYFPFMLNSFDFAKKMDGKEEPDLGFLNILLLESTSQRKSFEEPFKVSWRVDFC